MNKILFFGLMLSTITSCAQDKTYREKEVERSENKKVETTVSNYDFDYEISSEKKKQIIALKKKANRDFQKVGKDRSLSGYEKGRKKREISYKLRKDIDEIVGRAGRYDYSNNDQFDFERDSYRNKIDNQIDKLEDEYENDIKEIERKYSHDKDLMKSKKESRKAKFKEEKKYLKNLK